MDYKILYFSKAKTSERTIEEHEHEQKQIRLCAFIHNNLHLVAHQPPSKRPRSLYNVLVKLFAGKIPRKNEIDFKKLSESRNIFSIFKDCNYFLPNTRNKSGLDTYLYIGGEKNVNDLMKKYDRICRTIVYKCGKNRDKQIIQDLWQEARIGAWLAIRSHKDSKGPLHKRIYELAYQNVINYLRKLNRWEKDTLFSDMDVKDSDDDYDSYVDTIESYDINQEHKLILKERKDFVRKILGVISKKFSKREHVVLKESLMSNTPKSLRDIAKQFDTTYSSINRDKNRVLSTLKNEMKGIVNDI